MSSQKARFHNRLVDTGKVPLSVLDCVFKAEVKVFRFVDFSVAVEKWKRKGVKREV